MTSYEEMLEDAYEKVNPITSTRGRFEIPTAKGHFEGKKTIITNFSQIADHLRREPEHMQKFLLKEVAASGQIEGDRLVINNRVPSAKINQKIEQYTKEFVICKDCGKPDTELQKENRMTFMHCLACGAKHSVTGKI